MIGLNRRRVMGGSKPYAYEVEYLESTGTQYIDTLYYPNENTTLDVIFTPVRNNRSASRPDMILYGTGTGYADSNCLEQYAAYIDHAGTWISASDMYMRPNEKNRLRNVLEENNVKYIVYNYDLDTEETINFGNKTLTVTDTYTFLLYKLPRAKYCESYLRIHSFDIYESGVLAMSFIPVVDNQGVGCMYDKVSGQLFYNAGTGSFIVGQRV
jgi:hypothetical protein